MFFRILVCRMEFLRVRVKTHKQLTFLEPTCRGRSSNIRTFSFFFSPYYSFQDKGVQCCTGVEGEKPLPFPLPPC